MHIEKMEFGTLEDDAEASLFVLTNKNGIEAKITNYGGRLISLKVPDKNGVFEEVVLGFDSLAEYRSEKYLKEGPYFGALIGRYAGRIAKGRFSLDGQPYQLVANNGENHLHGGLKGFDKVVWTAEGIETEKGAGLTLTYTSPDGEEGYPGRLEVEVEYTLTNEDELTIAYRATTDRKTIVNLTNHAYFNLTGNTKRKILGHEVMIHAKTFLPISETLIPLGEQRRVEGTPFDFTTATAVGERIHADDEQLRVGKGYDHCWILEGRTGEMKQAATVYEPGSGRLIEMFTTEPGVQFYSANYLSGKLRGRGGVGYEQHTGLCLETQHFPDSPNQPQFPSVELNPGEIYQSKTSYKFSVK